MDPVEAPATESGGQPTTLDSRAVQYPVSTIPKARDDAKGVAKSRGTWETLLAEAKKVAAATVSALRTGVKFAVEVAVYSLEQTKRATGLTNLHLVIIFILGTFICNKVVSCCTAWCSHFSEECSESTHLLCM